jgi:hypothetical protein
VGPQGFHVLVREEAKWIKGRIAGKKERTEVNRRLQSFMPDSLQLTLFQKQNTSKRSRGTVQVEDLLLALSSISSIGKKRKQGQKKKTWRPGRVEWSPEFKPWCGEK